MASVTSVSVGILEKHSLYAKLTRSIESPVDLVMRLAIAVLNLLTQALFIRNMACVGNVVVCRFPVGNAGFGKSKSVNNLYTLVRTIGK